MNFDKILKIYKEREYKSIEESYNQQIEEIKMKDPIYCAFNELYKQLIIMIENDGQDTTKFNLEIYMKETFTRETKETIKQLVISQNEELMLLFDTIEEIEAQLEPVTDYENGIKILKLYGILDKKGKIINE